MTPATPESTAAQEDAGTPGASRIGTRPGWTTAALLAPAYGWLTFAVLLPLGVMLFFSVLRAAPFGNRPLEYTFDNYLAFIRRPYLFDIAWTSIQMGLWPTCEPKKVAYDLFDIFDQRGCRRIGARRVFPG